MHSDPTISGLDPAMVRAEFPALSSGFAYLDNAGGSLVLGRVGNRVRNYLLSSSVQLGASYRYLQEANDKVLTARHAVAGFINAVHDDEVGDGQRHYFADLPDNPVDPARHQAR